MKRAGRPLAAVGPFMAAQQSGYSTQRPSDMTQPEQVSPLGLGAVVSLHAAKTKEEIASARRTSGRRDMGAISIEGVAREGVFLAGNNCTRV
jgi:hypothetical protein